MRKIAYLLELDPIAHCGVLRKVLLQADKLKDLGVEVRLYIVSPRNCSSSEYEVINVFNCYKGMSFWSRGLRILNRILCSNSIKRVIKKFNPDHIYYREGVSFHGVNAVIKKYDTTMEVNSPVTVNELASNKILQALYRSGRMKLLSLANRVVAISHEVELDLNKLGFHNTVTICNGFDSDLYDKVVPSIKSSSESTVCLMVGSPGQYWQGYDELSALAKLYESRTDICFRVAGATIGDFPTPLPSNIELLGYMSAAELKHQLMEADVCFGTLAAYRKNIFEVSSLKHRLYVENRKPFISSVKDTDFSGFPFMLELENRARSLVDNKVMIDQFIYSIKTNDLFEVDISHLSESEKAKLRLKYIMGEQVQ